MDILKGLASILIIIGALNWGLVGLFNFDLVEYLFKGRDNIYARVIYTLIGLSGLYTLIYLLF
ncbi:DUF378 domain-containing protein [Caldisalinibacter kiritimatiensis]|uniref:DUF378 domain-containing protein n=1 Tax=Caldisalinibacter kiritimatiensis TaxID=1304284 RepID=R1AWN0_9FIRM|nr:DUF378 domain-containing protein [Caldisalinibacter kiritimatiensis]EOD01593.1 DUF378 domain-containing protein [Caldisalinibacter kiritimatiensis]